MTFPIIRIILIAYALTIAIALLFEVRLAFSHDWKRPDLDAWYQNLHRKSVTRDGSQIPCCSREDCHTTEAELRNGEWWARIGKPINLENDHIDWDLEDYVRIPDELIVRDDRGMPVHNPEGEAVICHTIVWKAQSWMQKGAGVLDPEHTTVYCFVPGVQS